MTVTAMSFLGRALTTRGDLEQAADTYKGVIDLINRQFKWPVPYSGYAYVGLAGLYYEWNDLEAAQNASIEGIKRSQTGGFVPYELVGNIFLARIHLAKGELEKSREYRERAIQLKPYCDYAYVLAVLAEIQVRLWLAGNELATAYGWAEEQLQNPVEPFTSAREIELMTAAMVLIKHPSSSLGTEPTKLDESLRLLADLLKRAEAAGRLDSIILILVYQALAYQVQGDLDLAAARLGQALSLGEPERYTRTFIDEGEPMANLLRLSLRQSISPEYAASLLAQFRKPIEKESAFADTQIEQLSERELDVLLLIAAGLSNPRDRRGIGHRLKHGEDAHQSYLRKAGG